MPEPVSYEERILAIGAERLARMTAPEIAAEVGCHHVYARRVVRAAGLDYLPTKTGRKPGAPMRDAVMALLAEGKTPREVAEATGSTPGSVHSMVYRQRMAEARA